MGSRPYSPRGAKAIRRTAASVSRTVRFFFEANIGSERTEDLGLQALGATGVAPGVGKPLWHAVCMPQRYWLSVALRTPEARVGDAAELCCDVAPRPAASRAEDPRTCWGDLANPSTRRAVSAGFSTLGEWPAPAI